MTRHLRTGVRTEALEAGQGGRPLLLVHGFTGAKEDFGDWIGRFAHDGWWVVAPDLRGHGAADQPDDEGAYSLATYADDLLALADVLGWDRFDLLGHSMGGMVAQELVLRGPHRVGRLVLMDTHHGPVEGVEPEAALLVADLLRRDGLEAFLEMVASLPAAPRAPSDARLRAERPGYAEFSDGKARRCATAMYIAMGLELTSRPDRLDELRSLDLPTLVVVGAEDRDFVGAAERMAAAIPGARHVVVPDAAHSPQFEHPEAWWAAVSGFLAGT